MPLPKKYKEKYQVPHSGSEQAAFFMAKVIGLLSVLLVFALGADVYRFIL